MIRPAIVLGFLAFAAMPLGAQISAASCSCNPKAGTLVIRFTPDRTAEKPSWAGDVQPVDFISLLVLDKPDGTDVEDTTSETFTCRLAKDRLEITLEPGVPNVNLLGRCGGAVTGVVTVKRNGAVVISEKEFETIDCTERTRYLRTITFRDGSRKPVFAFSDYAND